LRAPDIRGALEQTSNGVFDDKPLVFIFSAFIGG